MTNLAALLCKDYAAPTSATSGVAGYDLEGQKKKPAALLRAKRGVVELIAKVVSVDYHANEAATSQLNTSKQPTEGQKHAGNYGKGHFSINGLNVAIENPAGSRRRPEWPILKSHYGYAKRTEGADGDHVDVFIKPATSLDWGGSVFVVDQTDESGKFDEHKAMIGWSSMDKARQGYLENYEAGWRGLGAITEMPFEVFKQWLKNGDTKSPVSRSKST